MRVAGKWHLLHNRIAPPIFPHFSINCPSLNLDGKTINYQQLLILPTPVVIKNHRGQCKFWMDLVKDNVIKENSQFTFIKLGVLNSLLERTASDFNMIKSAPIDLQPSLSFSWGGVLGKPAIPKPFLW